MHIYEGRVPDINTPAFEKLRCVLENHIYKDLNHKTLHVSGQSAMWNSGVIGIHPDDAFLLNDVLSLTDQLCEHSNLHILEQFAFTHILGHRTTVQESAEVIFHYWTTYLRHPFRRKLPVILDESAALPLSERAHYCYLARPRPTFQRQGKALLNHCLQIAGFQQQERVRKNEW